MTQPLPYERDFDFEDFQSSHPSTPLPGDKVNVEFDQVAATIDAVRARIADLQRDDREVHNKVIGFDQLKDELRKGFTTPTVWAAGTSYEIGASVYVGRKVYAALVAHTSGANFNADNLTGKWYLLADFTAVTNVDQAAADAALAAKQSATSAAGSANAAQNSEVSAGASAATAAAARTAAGVSETNAAASASEAAATLAGTVKGPASSTTDNIALFSDATGKLLKDSGKKISDFGTGDMLAANDLSDLSSIPSSRANLVVGTFVADRTALKALDTTKDTLAYLKEPGCEGQFGWDGSDLSALVAIDTAEGVYVAPASDPTGASGAWVRKGWDALDTRWCGGSLDNTIAQNKAALQAALVLRDALGGGKIVNFVDYGLSVYDADTAPNNIAEDLNVVNDMSILDYGESSLSYPAPTKQGAQERHWKITPQTTPHGQHDGNQFKVAANWHPYVMIDANPRYIAPGSRPDDYNYRASCVWGLRGKPVYQMSMGNGTGDVSDDLLKGFGFISYDDNIEFRHGILAYDYATGNIALGASTTQAPAGVYLRQQSAGFPSVMLHSFTTTLDLVLRTSNGAADDWYIKNTAGLFEIYSPAAGTALSINRTTRAASFASSVSASFIKVASYPTSGRPDPVACGAGAMIFDTDLGIALWSNGSAWIGVAMTAM